MKLVVRNAWRLEARLHHTVIQGPESKFDNISDVGGDLVWAEDKLA